MKKVKKKIEKKSKTQKNVFKNFSNPKNNKKTFKKERKMKIKLKILFMVSGPFNIVRVCLVEAGEGVTLKKKTKKYKKLNKNIEQIERKVF